MTPIEVRNVVEQAETMIDYLPVQERWRARWLAIEVRKLASQALRLEDKVATYERYGDGY